MMLSLILLSLSPSGPFDDADMIALQAHIPPERIGVAPAPGRR
jgi:hypothetical protein